MSVTEDARSGGNGYVGQAMQRREDPRLITGRGQLHRRHHPARACSTWRSCARPRRTRSITSIDTARGRGARRRARRLHRRGHRGDLLAPLPMAWVPPGVDDQRRPSTGRWPAARSSHVGEAVAVVIGDEQVRRRRRGRGRSSSSTSRCRSVVDPEEALEDGSPLVHEQFGTNKTARVVAGRRRPRRRASPRPTWSSSGASSTTARPARRSSRAPALAEYRAGDLTLWTRHPDPAPRRASSWPAMLGMPEDRLRVIAPDVGGGFGSKLNLYGEEVLVRAASRKLERPVKWTETRSEDMSTPHHGRDQIDYVQAGRQERRHDHRRCHIKVLADLGAYYQLLTPFIPSLHRVRGGRLLQDPGDPDRRHRGLHQQVPDRRRSAAPGGPRRRTCSRCMVDQLARRAGHGPARGAAQELHPQGGLPGRASRSASSTTRATTTARSTSCWRTSTWTRSSRSRRRCARRASTAASASPPTWRSAAWRRRASSARAASASRAASGSRRSCACTRRAR